MSGNVGEWMQKVYASFLFFLPVLLNQVLWSLVLRLNRQEQTHTHTHTSSHIRSKLTEASAMQTMTGLLYRRIHKTRDRLCRFQRIHVQSWTYNGCKNTEMSSKKKFPFMTLCFWTIMSLLSLDGCNVSVGGNHSVLYHSLLWDQCCPGFPQSHL